MKLESTYDLSAFVPIIVVIVVAKFGSFPNAIASSFNVSKVAGAVPTRLLIAVDTFVSVSVFV